MNSTTKAIAAVLVAVVVLYGGYRIYHHVTYKAPTPAPTVAPVASASPEAMENSVYKTMAMTDGSGNYFTDESGMSLYVFAKDTSGVSNCTGACLVNWPAFGPKVAPDSNTQFPENIAVISRSEGGEQYTYKGMPLYYYIGDKKAGDTTGTGIPNWSLAK